MKIGDIAALIASGRSVSEVKEISELEKTTPEVVELAKTGKSMEELKELISMADTGEETPEEHPAGAAESEQKSQDTADYETLYKESQEKIATLEKTVKQIQKENTSKDVAPAGKSIDDILQEII